MWSWITQLTDFESNLLFIAITIIAVYIMTDRWAEDVGKLMDWLKYQLSIKRGWAMTYDYLTVPLALIGFTVRALATIWVIVVGIDILGSFVDWLR